MLLFNNRTDTYRYYPIFPISTRDAGFLLLCKGHVTGQLYKIMSRTALGKAGCEIQNTVCMMILRDFSLVFNKYCVNIIDKYIDKANKPLRINLQNKTTSYVLLYVTLNDGLLSISLLSFYLEYMWPNKKE